VFIDCKEFRMSTATVAAPSRTPHRLSFRSLRRDVPGYSFPCDARGQVDLDALSPHTRNDYLFARALVGHRYCTPAVTPGPGAERRAIHE
jgi:hypothetical protein